MTLQNIQNILGEFCTQHKDAVDLYKNYSKPNSDFKRFEEFCKNSPLLKKRGIYECILHVSLILTKYPLLIQPMIETSEDPVETGLLQKSLKLSQVILITFRVNYKYAILKSTRFHFENFCKL